MPSMDTFDEQAPHTHTLLSLVERSRWQAGQMSFHPSTQVLCGSGPMAAEAAEQWAMVACTWRGRAYWYGYAVLEFDDGATVEGWVLVPRAPSSGAPVG